MIKKSMMSLMAGLVLATFAFTTTQAAGQSNQTTQDKSSTTMKHDHKDHTSMNSSLASSDRKFIVEAAQGGSAEVALGRMAVDKATDPDVKQFGQRMIDDHSKANDELQQLASQKGVSPPMGDPATASSKLNGLSGAAFDREYVHMMVKDHEKDVKEFETQSTKAKDADLREWVTKTLPTLREHLQQIRDIQTRLKSTK